MFVMVSLQIIITYNICNVFKCMYIEIVKLSHHTSSITNVLFSSKCLILFFIYSSIKQFYTLAIILFFFSYSILT